MLPSIAVSLARAALRGRKAGLTVWPSADLSHLQAGLLPADSPQQILGNLHEVLALAGPEDLSWK